MKSELNFWRWFATLVTVFWIVSAFLFNLALKDVVKRAEDRIKNADEMIMGAYSEADKHYNQRLTTYQLSLDVCWQTARRLADELEKKSE